MTEKELEAFKWQVWRLERLATKCGGFLKIVPTKPTTLRAYAAKMYRAVSRMSFVDMPNVVPDFGEVCAFTVEQWASMPLWDVYDTLRRCRGRLALAVVTGSSFRAVSGQVLVTDAAEVARITV